MFAFPEIGLLPALGGLGMGTLEWPAVSVMLAWFCFAALVGAFLAFVRDYAGGSADAVRPATSLRVIHAAGPRAVVGGPAHAHREAA